jgi:DtxR family Mn-dependent transcriptional regulator
MIKDVWKKYDQAELQHSSVHHLLAIHILHKDFGYARAIDVSRYLELTRGSVSITLKKLREKGYVVEDQNKFLSLSDRGHELVNAVLSKRRLMETFFRDVLGLPPEIAEADACKIEHLLTQETSAKVLSFIGLYLADNKSAKAFRKAFARQIYHCDQSDESCEFCEEKCYFAGKEELFQL